jgi:hypothetical protein
VRSEKLVAEAGDSSEPRGRGISTVGSCYQATASKDSEDFMCAVITVIFGVSNSVRLSQLFVVTFCKCSINPIINSNPVYNQSSDNINYKTMQLKKRLISVQLTMLKVTQLV